MMQSLNIFSKFSMNKNSIISLSISSIVFSFFITAIYNAFGEGYIFFEIAKNIIKVFSGSCILLTMLIILSSLNFKAIAMVLSTIIACILNIVLFPELNYVFLHNSLQYMYLCLIPCISISVLDDFPKLSRCLIKVSKFIGIINFVFIIGVALKLFNINNSSEYYMGLGYSCVIPIMVLTYNALKEENNLDIVYIVFLTYSVLVYGSRGPLLCIFSFILYIGIKRCSVITKNLMITFFIFIALLYSKILRFIHGLLLDLNIYSRTLDLLNNNIEYLSGRDHIYSTLLNLITDDPLLIRGINAEYLILNNYAHNIVLELIYQLGVLLGGFICIIIFVYVIKDLLPTRLTEKKVITLLFLFASIPSLFVSSSIWNNYIFWLWVGIKMNNNNQ